MAGTAITVKIEDREVKELLSRVQARMNDLTPALKIIGNTIRASIIRNFEKAGRPVKWAKHSEITEKRRGKGAKILRAQGFAGGLMGSIHPEVKKDRVIIGTNKAYAAVHQFGAKKGSFGTVIANIKAHLRKGRKVAAHTRKMKLPWGDIPARPFMMVQDEDWAEIRAALNEHIMGGNK